MMTLSWISDLLLAGGALGAAFFCFVLSRKLSRFSDLEKGMGGAIAVLSVQVDDMNKALAHAKSASTSARTDLEALTEKAEAAVRRLELMLASMHDLPEPETRSNTRAAPAAETATPTSEAPDSPTETETETETEKVEPGSQVLKWRSRRPLAEAAE